jgi:integrase/recombinase XerD
MMTTAFSLIDSYIEHERLAGKSEKTIKAYSFALLRLENALGIRDWREISPKDLRSYWKSVKCKRASATAHSYLRPVKAFLRFLTQTHRLLVDPSAELPLPRINRNEMGPILCQDDLKRLLAACDILTPCGIRDRAIVEFLYSTGLRVSEFRKMRVADVDLGKAEVIVRNGKGAKDRVQPLNRAAVEWTRKYLEPIRPEFERSNPGVEELFISFRGRRLSEQIAAIHLRNLGRAAGLRVSLTCHVIRRTIATDLLRNGASPAQVAAFLGHANLASLARYVKIAAREVKEIHQEFHPREKDEVDDE